MLRYICGTLCVAALSSCGAGGGASLQASSGSVGVSHNGSTGAYAFSANGSALSELYDKTPDGTYLLAGFTPYKNADYTQFAYANAAQNSIVAVMASSQHSSNNFADTTYSRSSAPTNLSGTATYTGSYAGFLRNGTSSNASMRYITEGDVTLNADFNNDLLSGTINDRRTHEPVGFTERERLGTIVLNQTSISGSSTFSGSTSGGQSSSGSSASGVYSGIFAGSNGQEVVGGVRLNYTLGGNTVEEVGAIFAQ